MKRPVKCTRVATNFSSRVGSVLIKLLAWIFQSNILQALEFPPQSCIWRLAIETFFFDLFVAACFLLAFSTNKYLRLCYHMVFSFSLLLTFAFVGSGLKSLMYPRDPQLGHCSIRKIVVSCPKFWMCWKLSMYGLACAKDSYKAVTFSSTH